MTKRLGILLLTAALLFSLAACDIVSKKPDQATSDGTTTASDADGTTTASPNDGTTAPSGDNAATGGADDAPSETDSTTGTDASRDPEAGGDDIGDTSDGVTLESVQSNPTLALLLAASQTMAKLDTPIPTPDILNTMQDFLQNGSASLTFENPTIFEAINLKGLSALNATYYHAQESSEQAFEFVATSADGGEARILLYSNCDLLILAADIPSEDLELTYSVKTADLSNDEWIDAFLAKLNDAGFSLPTESLEELRDLSDRLTAADTSAIPSLEEMDFSWIVGALNGLAPEVYTELTNLGYSCVFMEYIFVSYTLTAEKTKPLLKEALTQIELTDEMAKMICEVLEIETMTGAELRTALEQTLNDRIDQVSHRFEIEASATALISPRDGDLDEVTVCFSVKNLETDQTVSVSLSYNLENLPNQLTLHTAVSTPDGAASQKLTIARYEKDGVYSYYLTLAKPNGDKTQEHGAKLEYEQSTGAFTLTLTLGDSESPQIAPEITEEIIITGTLKSEDGVVRGAVDRIRLASRDVSLVNVGLTLTVTPGISEPFKPENPVDIGTLTAEELRELLEVFLPNAEETEE